MTQRRREGIFYGWWIILVCSLIGLFAAASRLSFTMFLPTFLEDLGWTRAMLGFGFTAHMWTYGLGSILMGFIVDKYGARVAMTLGGLLIVIALCLTATMRSVWEFYLYYGITLGLGVSATLAVPGVGTARKWFVKKAGLAVAIATAGGSLGLALIGPLAKVLIPSYGWRTSYLIIGPAFGILITFFALIFVRKDPESVGLLPDGDISEQVFSSTDAEHTNVTSSEETWTVLEAFKTRSYWCILFAYGIAGFAVLGITAHIGAWSNDIGIAAGLTKDASLRIATISVVLFAFATVIGKLIGGPLSDRIGRKPVLFIAAVFLGISFMWAAVLESPNQIIFACPAVAASFGIGIPAFGPILGDLYGRLSVATLFGFLTFFAGMIGGAGATIYGWIFDITESYTWAFLTCFALCFVFALLVFLIKQEKKKVISEVPLSDSIMDSV